MILVVLNDPIAPLGDFAELLQSRRSSFQIWRPFAEPLPANWTASSGVIVLGGTMGVHDVADHPFLDVVKDWMTEVLRRGIPLLGICLGGQLLAEVTGGDVASRCNGEKGVVTATLTAAGMRDPLFAGLDPALAVFQWHNDSFTPPKEATLLATSSKCPHQAFRVGNAWGLQFHPEVNGAIVGDWCRDSSADAGVLEEYLERKSELTAKGAQVLLNFLAMTESDQGNASAQSAVNNR